MVGVDDDEVVAIVGAAQERAGVRVVHGQAWIVLEPEVATADAADGRVELDAVDLRLRVIDPECAGGRPGGVPENRNPLERPSEQRRQREERIPDAAGEHLSPGRHTECTATPSLR